MNDLTQIHKNCTEIFRNNFFELPTGETLGDVKYYGSSSACKIYDKLTEGDHNTQDCIGENFNQLIVKLNDNWFENYKPTYDLDFYFINYFLLLYLFVERVDLIFEILNRDGRSKLFADYHGQNFKTLRKINKWANFIKHPKEFLFTHWPTYFIENDPDILVGKDDVKIDTAFIFKHYNFEKQERPIILENNQRVFVEIPHLETLTENFCKEINLFFEFICANQIVANFLKKKSTIKNHYSDDETGELNNVEDVGI